MVPARWPDAPSAAPPGRRAADGPRVTTGAASPRTGTAQAPTVSVGRAARPVPASGPAPLPVAGAPTPPLVVRPAPAPTAPGGLPPGRPIPVARPAVARGAGGANPPPLQRATGTPRPDGGPPPAPGAARPVQAAAVPGRAERVRETGPQGSDTELDDLARRLLDPVARLLRTELRRGRERAGRPFDGRR
ncbi:hypothetical protein GCM10019017_11900 [Streptomyces showdoensis]